MEPVGSPATTCVATHLSHAWRLGLASFVSKLRTRFFLLLLFLFFFTTGGDSKIQIEKATNPFSLLLLLHEPEVNNSPTALLSTSCLSRSPNENKKIHPINTKPRDSQSFHVYQRKRKENRERMVETYSQHMHIRGKRRDCRKN